MRAMVVTDSGGLVWNEVPEPVPGTNEVLLEIHATAVNRADLLQRAGKYPPPPGWPLWMGLEVAGVVLQAPEQSRWRPGDEVCALLGGGGYAERIVVPESLVLPVPKGMPLLFAASLPEAYATSWLNLVIEAGLKEGDTVLIQAGASGLGMAAIQVAKALGAKVITTVGSSEKERAVSEVGADIVVNRRSGNLGKVLDEHPVDIAMDCVGGNSLGNNIEKLAIGGRWILIATLGGEQTSIPLRPILKRGLRLIGSTLRSRTDEMKSRVLCELSEALWSRFEDGTIKPTIYKVLPVAQAEEAHAILARNENIGKIVLTMV